MREVKESEEGIKLEEVKAVIKEWADKQGHDRCWYYPDLFNKLIKVLDIKVSKDPSLPPLSEFKKGCEKYQEEEYIKNKLKQ